MYPVNTYAGNARVAACWPGFNCKWDTLGLFDPD